jgi:hypothetical protein
MRAFTSESLRGLTHARPKGAHRAHLADGGMTPYRSVFIGGVTPVIPVIPFCNSTLFSQQHRGATLKARTVMCAQPGLMISYDIRGRCDAPGIIKRLVRCRETEMHIRGEKRPRIQDVHQKAFKPITTGGTHERVYKRAEPLRGTDFIAAANASASEKNNGLKMALMTVAGVGRDVNANGLGAYLSRYAGRPIAGFNFTSPKGHGGTKLWRLEKSGT